MAITRATIAGTFYLPDGVTRRNLHVTVQPVGPDGSPRTVYSTTEPVVISGSLRGSTVAGVLSVTLPVSSELRPADSKYLATFTTFGNDQAPTPAPILFSLLGSATWIGLANGENGTVATTLYPSAATYPSTTLYPMGA